MYFRILTSLLIFCFTIAGSNWVAGCNTTEPPPTPSDTLITYERELTNGEQPAVSPDGTKIAFTRNGDIHVMDTSGTNIKQLTNGAENDLMPRWHPNGQAIGFIRASSGEYNKALIFSVSADGGSATQLVFGQFVADSLIQLATRYGGIGIPIWDWSPTGDQVGFLQQNDFKTWLKVIIVSASTEIYGTQLYDKRGAFGGNGSSFVWLTNDRIAFIGQNTVLGGKSGGGTKVFLYDLSTGVISVDSSHAYPYYVCKNPINNQFGYFSFGKIIITDFSGSFSEHPIYGGGWLRWSPNSRFILFENPRYYPNPFGYRESRLGIYDLERNKQYLLTQKGDIDRDNGFFDWGKSSEVVYFEKYKKISVVQFRFYP